MAREVDARAAEAHSLAAQAARVDRESRHAAGPDDAVAGHARVIALAEDVADRARRSHAAGDEPHERVGGDAPRRDRADGAVDGAGPGIQGHDRIMAIRRATAYSPA
jgi:hypothetical protein